MAIQPMPHEKGLDNTVHVLKEGYSYILNRRKKFQSDVFETHLLGQKAICMGGEAAAELFYDTTKFKRAGAAPKRVQKTLFGEKGVQTLDGKEHEHRKEMFMSLMSPQQLEKMNDRLKKIGKPRQNSGQNKTKSYCTMKLKKFCFEQLVNGQVFLLKKKTLRN